MYFPLNCIPVRNNDRIDVVSLSKFSSNRRRIHIYRQTVSRWDTFSYGSVTDQRTKGKGREREGRVHVPVVQLRFGGCTLNSALHMSSGAARLIRASRKCSWCSWCSWCSCSGLYSYTVTHAGGGGVCASQFAQVRNEELKYPGLGVVKL